MWSLSVPPRDAGLAGLAIGLLGLFLLTANARAEEPAAPAAPAPAADPGPPTRPAGAATDAPAPFKSTIVYLGKDYDEPLPLSYAEPIITDKGIQGARLSVDESKKSGAFVGRDFALDEEIVPKNGDVVAKAKEILAKGDALIVADLEPKDLLAVADLPEAKNSIIVNIRSSTEALRQEDCRSNVFHIIPDWAMRADALAQYLIWKKWPRWFVLTGDTPEDKDFVAQIERAAKRYGGKIVEKRVYNFPPGARNLDSGHQQVQAQMPMATEGAPDYDMLIVADTAEAFGDYLPFRTYEPRPVGRHPRPAGARLGPVLYRIRRHELPERHPQAGQAGPGRARLHGLARRATLADGGDALGQDHRAGVQGVPALRRLQSRRLQGHRAELPRLGSPDAPAGFARRRHPHRRLEIAAGRLPARDQHHRHARLRQAGDQVQIQIAPE